MDVRALQAFASANQYRNADRRMVEQFNRLNVGNQENGHNIGGSPNYENISNERKMTHEVQTVPNRRANFQPGQSPNSPKNGEGDGKKDLMKPGDMIKNRWRILNKIGGGGFGEIYQAFDTQVSVLFA